jgi:hypothetical protein
MKRIVFMVTVALVVALIVVGGAASAKEPEAVSIRVGPTAQLDGGDLLVTVEVACEPGWQVLEAHVSATQGATTSTLAGIGGVVCDGKPHVHTVRVNALDGQFSRGKASVSAFVLLLDPATQTTVQGQDARTVTVLVAR